MYIEQKRCVYLYMYPVEDIADLRRLKNYDDYTRRSIEEAKALIAEAESYRIKLHERAQALQTMEQHHQITLKREKRYDNKVFYFLNHDIVYTDGTRCMLKSQKYTGTERQKAIVDFETSKKTYTAYEHIKDIDLKPWERK